MRHDFVDTLLTGEHLDCPTCGRHAQIYKRTLHHSVAMQLIQLHKLGGDWQYVHASALILKNQAGSGDLGKAKYWGLIEQMHHESDKTKSSGYWKLTQQGVAFVKGVLTIRKYARVFDDELIDLTGDHVTIEQCLGERYSYEELMRA